MIYFDNAATSCPKPRCVRDEVTKYLSGYYCGNPGRGSHVVSLAAARAVYDCRCKLSEFFGLSVPENVIFTYNATYALNIAIKGVIGAGDHVIISNLEHNSVLRPIAALSKLSVKYDVFDALLDTEAMLLDIKSKIRPNTKAIVCLHASNVCGAVLPIRKIGELCSRYGLKFIVDASQSAGSIPINMKEDNIDILCAPGHKGLLGPQGSGFVLVSPSAGELGCLIEGGNGLNSLDLDMGSMLPERLEAGTVSTPAIAGLGAGIDFLRSFGVQNVYKKETRLAGILKSKLSTLKGIVFYGPGLQEGGIVLFNIEGMNPSEVSDRLSADGVCIRSGYHCSPLAHEALKTPSGGAVRASFGIFNTENEIDEFCKIVKKIINS